MTDSTDPIHQTESEREQHDRNRLAWLAYLRHELRTPINAVIGYSEMLMEDATDGGDGAFLADLERVHASGKQLLAAVNHFLDPAAIEASLRDGSSPISNADLHHELRVPLNAIVGYSEILIEDAHGRADEAILSDLRRIHTSGGKLTELIDSLVSLSQAEPEEITRNVEQGASEVMRQAVAVTGREAPAEAPRTPPAVVLVVDDNEVNRDILGRRLVQEGHTVVQAEDGASALELMNEQRFDLVLLDIMMPGLTGYDVLERMRARPDWGEIPVIVISALYEMDSVVKCIEMGAEDYLPKPFNAVLLRARVSASLEKKRLREAKLAQEKAEAERLKREIEVAARVQRQLLPKAPPEVPGVDLAGSCSPALEVGGDYFDFLELGSNQLGIAIADVAGKGMPAALLMASMQAGLRSGANPDEDRITDLVSSLNKLVHGLTDGHTFLTFFYAQFNRTTKMLHFVNAGHNPPLLLRASDSGQPSIVELTEGGPVIGFLPGLPYNQDAVRINPGDALVAFTDGVTEAFNTNLEEFGDERLRSAALSAAQLPAAGLMQTIVERVREWRGEASQSDDITVVVMKLNPDSAG